MSFNRLRVFWQQRLVRAGVGILVLAAAALASYKLTHVPQPVDLAASGKFSPASVKLAEQVLIIEGPLVNREEGLLFSYDSGTNGTAQVEFDRASLSDQNLESFARLNFKLPAGWAPISYRTAEAESSATVYEPCSTRIELRVAAADPAEIRIFQLYESGAERRRDLQITASGAGLVASLETASNGDSSAPGCQKLLKVDDVSHPTSLPVTVRVAENSRIDLSFLALAMDSASWADAQGSVALDLGGPPKLSPTDAPPFQARAVSIRALTHDPATTAAPVLSARSEAGGPLLSISGLKVFSDQLQISVAGKGSLEIDGVAQTTDFLKFIKDNQPLALVLGAAYAALLAWVARLVFKAPRRSRSTKYD